MHSRQIRTIALGTVFFFIFAISLVVIQRSRVSAHAAVLGDWGTGPCLCNISEDCGGTRFELEFGGQTYCVPSCDADINNAAGFEQNMFDYYCGTTACLPGQTQPNWDDFFDEWEISCGVGGGGPPINPPNPPNPGLPPGEQPDPGDGSPPPGGPPPGGDPPPGGPPPIGSPGGPPNTPGQNNCNGISSGDPVELGTGSKSEYNVDLSIQVPGQDFTLTRHDTSNPAHTGAGLIGNYQTMGVFIYVTAGFEIIDFPLIKWHVDLHGIAATRKFRSNEIVLFNPTGDNLPPANEPYRNEGPSTDYFLPTFLQIDSKHYAVWRHVQPGKWEQYFYRQWDELGQWEGGHLIEVTPTQYKGLLLLERDPYENSRYYTYKKWGPPGSVEARLQKVFVNGLPGPAVAVINFDWHAGPGSDGSGRLTRAQVFNGAGSLTHEVEYSYQGGPGATREALGTDGDLVLVRHREKLDGENAWRTRVVHYRFHNPILNEPLDPEYDSDIDGFVEFGHEHQLKLIVAPEQIEYVAALNGMTVDQVGTALLGMDDSDTFVASGLKVTDFASKIVAQYEDSVEKRVKLQYVQAGCGCGGGNPGRRLSYDYWEYGPMSEISETVKITEHYYENGDYSALRYTTYHDLVRLGQESVPYLDTHAVLEDELNPNARKWVTHYEYDVSRREIKRVLPSALDSYSPGAPPDVGPATEPDYAASITQGLAYAYSYNAENLLTTTAIGTGDGNYTLTERTTYGDGNDDVLKYLPVTRERFPTAVQSPPPNEIERTDFTYGFWETGTFKIAWKEIKVEAELEQENGSGGDYVIVQLIDESSNNYWTKAADGSLTKRVFDTEFGKVESVTRNAEPEDPNNPYPFDGVGVAGWGRDQMGNRLAGDPITVSYTYDDLGRRRSRTVATEYGTATTYTARQMRNIDTQGNFPYYTEIELPHLITGNVNDPTGPARLVWYNAAGKQVATMARTISWQSNYHTDITDIQLSDEVARSMSDISLDGLVISRKVWHNLGLDAFYETKYQYDSLGRLLYTIKPNGTVFGYEYDVVDHKKRDLVGVVDGVGNPDPTLMVAVGEYFYDSNGTTIEGNGNGKLTLAREYVDDIGAYRDTIFTYDDRDRLIKTENPLPPHQFVVYDNLDRVTKAADFSQLPASNDPSAIDTITGRLSYVESYYSQRGLQYKTRIAMNPGASGPLDFSEGHSWFDENGRAVGAWSTGGVMAKTTYDGLGRVATAFTTDRGGDALPGAPANHADVYDSSLHKANVLGDVVFRQVNNRFRPTGLVDLVTVYRRTHDVADTATGELTDPAFPLAGVITSYVGSYYDEVNRPIRTINFGTNGTEVFQFGGATPTWPPANYEQYNDANYVDFIVTASEYNVLEQLETETDPNGRVTKYLYDDLYRQIAVIENYENAVVVWNNDRWRVSSGLDPAAPDTDRVTSFVLDSNGNTTKQVAHFPSSGGGEDVQITEYVYGVSTPESMLNTNDLLHQIRYPDEATGFPGTSTDYFVTYSYNRAGNPITMTDQNGVVHTYTLDLLGRTIRDDVTIPPPSGIDAKVTAITFAYDDLGRQELIESRDIIDAVINAVKFQYTSYGEIEKVWQESNGPVDDDGQGADSPNVIYAYETVPLGAAKSWRLKSVTYPDGATIDYKYGNPADLDARISRVTSLFISGERQDLVAYDYLATSTFATVEYPEPWVYLDRSVEYNGEQFAGRYPSWDTFGRLISHLWIDGEFGPLDPPSAQPAVPPIVQLSYTYDKRGNRLARNNLTPTISWPDRDEEFTYDGLDRVTESARGVRVDPATFTYAPNSQQWDLDMLGNWDSVWTDADSLGSYATEESREHNEANEITTRDPDGGGPGSALALAFDDSGNITTQDQTGSAPQIMYIHDGWNRLVEVQYGAGATRGRYEYNGLGWRITKEADVHGATASDPPDGVLDEDRRFYYSFGWKLLQEDIDDDLDGTLDHRAQTFWGLRGGDDVVMRRRDANLDGVYENSYYHLTDDQFSTIALIGASGSLIERISYDPYGEARHHRMADLNGDGATGVADQLIQLGNWGAYGAGDLDRNGIVGNSDWLLLLGDWGGALPAGQLTNPGVDNHFGYAGYVFNAESQLYVVRFRWYAPDLGRFLERDPAGYADGMLLYMYAMNSPLLLVDPLGLATETQEIRGYKDGVTGTYIHSYERGLTGLFKNEFAGTQFVPDFAQGSSDFFGDALNEFAAERRHQSQAIGNAAGHAADGLEVAATAATIAILINVPDPSDLVTAAALFGVKRAGGRLLIGAARAADSSIEAGLSFRKFSRGNFRHNLRVLSGEGPRGFQAHHIFPNKFRNKFDKIFHGSGVSIDDPRFGAWVEATGHRKLTRAYNDEWTKFFQDNLNSTVEGTLGFGRDLARKYSPCVKSYF